MNAVIIYDDCAGAAKAKLMLERAARRADAALLWIVKPWRLDLLVPSLAADAALTDAADAHLMVLVLRHSPLLPAWLQDWFAQWAARRQVQDAALALWDGGNGDMLPATIERDLSQFAERHGLSFIYGGVGPAEDESATGARSEREMFSSPTLQPIRERALEGN